MNDSFRRYSEACSGGRRVVFGLYCGERPWLKAVWWRVSWELWRSRTLSALPNLRAGFRTGPLFASFSPDPGMLQDPVFYGNSAVHENFLAASAQNFLAASAHGLGWPK